MKIVFTMFYPQLEKDFGVTDGGKKFGHKLLGPNIKLKKHLERLGYEVCTKREVTLEQADIVVSWDCNSDMKAEIEKLPKTLPCILLGMESPVYCPTSHQLYDVLSPRWNAVVTWNRSFTAPHIFPYDMPIVGRESDWAPLSPNPIQKGVVISTFTRFRRVGVVAQREKLFLELEREGKIDIFGKRWPHRPAHTLIDQIGDQKLLITQNYQYAVACENAIYPGYVTEKLADCILAGVPCLYYGDRVSAERRFPGCFVPLTELTKESFEEAEATLKRNYETLKKNIEKQAAQSEKWCDNFIEAFTMALEYATTSIPAAKPLKTRGSR